MNKPTHLPSARLPVTQRGASLMEILVAMLILGIGLSALLAAQLRGVANAQEAHTQTVLTQAAQNLIENMQSNPVLIAGNNGWTQKDYSAYTQTIKQTSCTFSDNMRLSKAQLAEWHLCRFQNELRQFLPHAHVHYTICQDSLASEPIVKQNQVDFRCNQQGNAMMLKIVWQMNTEAEQHDLKRQGSRAWYHHQIYLPN